MNAKESGRIVGLLILAYFASRQGFVQHKILKAISICISLREDKNNIEEFVEGMLEEGVNVGMINNFLPWLKKIDKKLYKELLTVLPLIIIKKYSKLQEGG